jgi:hypothetical protein
MEVAFEMCMALHRAGFTVLLTGGSAPTYDTVDAYLCDDLDFAMVSNGQHF